jgi:hypothetical protein
MLIEPSNRYEQRKRCQDEEQRKWNAQYVNSLQLRKDEQDERERSNQSPKGDQGEDRKEELRVA